MWDPPGPGIKPMSPALAGRCFTSEPPGKLHISLLYLPVYIWNRLQEVWLLNQRVKEYIILLSIFRRRQWHPTPVLFAWKIPWMEKPGRLQSMGSLRVRHDWATSLLIFTFMHWRRKWQPTPVFLPGESQGRRSLVGCRLWGLGSHRVGHDWSDLAAAAEA